MPSAKNNFCIVPFSSLLVAPNGMVRTCTVAWDDLRKNKESTVKEVWSGQSIKMVRDHFLNGDYPAQCQLCKKKEEAGYLNRRQRMNLEWENQGRVGLDGWMGVINSYKNNKAPKLQYLDISFSNTCNLNCVMCSSEYSTSWIRHDSEFLKGQADFRKEVQPFLHKTQVEKNFSTQLLEFSPQLQRIIIKGGEPLADPNCLDFLDQLPGSGFSGDLWITTNGTLLQDKVLEVLSRLKSLNLTLSIDGVEQVYEWIRGVAFSRVAEGLRKACELNNIKMVKVAFTASAYNLWNIPSFMSWDQQMKGKYKKYEGASFINYVYQDYIRGQNIPRQDRLQVIEKIDKYFADLYQPEELKNLFVYLGKAEYPIEKRGPFFQWTDFCNKMRDLDIYDCEPRLRELREEFFATTEK